MRGRIEQADEMIRSLDECISELKAGKATVGKNKYSYLVMMMIIYLASVFLYL